MKTKEIDWIEECLPHQLLYPYFNGKYALELLGALFSDQTNIGEIKASRWAKLLNKPEVKKLVANWGSGKISSQDIANHWGDEVHFLRLTIARWGVESKKKDAYYQVSRPERNLVLQVNFDGSHDQAFYRFLKRSSRDRFECHAHPINQRLMTMGWIRMDIDINAGEVLIEEIQTDWIREVKSIDKYISNGGKDDSPVSPKRFRKYLPAVRPYVKMWDEMLMSAAIHFITRQLGIRKIWYHTCDSGVHYKMMPSYSLPPRSVYTKLPAKFGFQEVNEAPKLIKECQALKSLVRRGKHLNFYKLEI